MGSRAPCANTKRHPGKAEGRKKGKVSPGVGQGEATRLQVSSGMLLGEERGEEQLLLKICAPYSADSHAGEGHGGSLEEGQRSFKQAA